MDQKFLILPLAALASVSDFSPQISPFSLSFAGGITENISTPIIPREQTVAATVDVIYKIG